MSTFKKGHYEFVAKVLSSVQPIDDGERGLYLDQRAQWENTCLAFLNQFKSDNPQFDRERFLKACKGD